ncbi:hypothetical protein QJS10_CPB17g01711 [Acorus calamus]|uniref:Uncharacterized protein n=1 Tax=Acorus calamus TaxID=4465 RepID=A0AAV9CXR5_ACOCL|nr:hypothetical protein QJS10_CPB17g01711 [Acorus calamus]
MVQSVVVGSLPMMMGESRVVPSRAAGSASLAESLPSGIVDVKGTMAFQGKSGGWVRQDGQKVYAEGRERGWVSEVVPDRAQGVISAVAHFDGYQGGGCVESRLAGKVGGMLEYPRLSVPVVSPWCGRT